MAMNSEDCAAQNDAAVVAAAVAACLAQWRGHKSFAWAGECGIFADHVFYEALRHGVEVRVDSFNNALDSDSKVEMPPGVDREELEKLGVFQGLNHVWLVHGGLHYDAASPQGVRDPSQLISFQLCLAYQLQAVAPARLNELCVHHAWWRAAVQLAAEFDIVHAQRDNFYEPN